MNIYFKAIIILSLTVLVVCPGCVSDQHRFQPGRTSSPAELSKDGNSIYIETTPIGANVLINNEFNGVTPLTVKLPADKPVFSLVVTKEGYETEEITLTPREERVSSRGQNVVVKSTIFFGVIGWVVGLASGKALQGLGGGTLIGLTVGLLQEDKDENLTTRYEYPHKDIHIKLSPITTTDK